MRPFELWAEERVGAVLEANAQRWLDGWMRSPAGRRLLATVFADVAADALAPTGDGGSALLEEVLVGVVARMGREPQLRARLLEALGAGGTRPQAGS